MVVRGVGKMVIRGAINEGRGLEVSLRPSMQPVGPKFRQEVPKTPYCCGVT